MANNGTGNEPGEKTYKQTIAQEIIFSPNPFIISIHQIGNLLKCKKADTQGQKDFGQRNHGAKNGVDIGYEKISVFKIPQKPDIEQDAKFKDCLGTGPALAAIGGAGRCFLREENTQHIVHKDRNQNNRQKSDFHESIKKQRGTHQPDIGYYYQAFAV